MSLQSTRDRRWNSTLGITSTATIRSVVSSPPRSRPEASPLTFDRAASSFTRVLGSGSMAHASSSSRHRLVWLFPCFPRTTSRSRVRGHRITTRTVFSILRQPARASPSRRRRWMRRSRFPSSLRRPYPRRFRPVRRLGQGRRNRPSRIAPTARRGLMPSPWRVQTTRCFRRASMPACRDGDMPCMDIEANTLKVGANDEACRLHHARVRPRQTRGIQPYNVGRSFPRLLDVRRHRSRWAGRTGRPAAHQRPLQRHGVERRWGKQFPRGTGCHALARRRDTRRLGHVLLSARRRWRPRLVDHLPADAGARRCVRRRLHARPGHRDAPRRRRGDRDGGGGRAGR
jgi:hypothetical protein